MLTGLARGATRTVRGIGAAVRARPLETLGVVAGVFALHALLPPLLLAVARKPWTFFTFNPWLKQLPAYLASGAPKSPSAENQKTATRDRKSSFCSTGAPEAR